MFSRNFSLDDPQQGITWQDLGNGVPTIVAMAHLSSVAMSQLDPEPVDIDKLSDEAKAILVCARSSGSICIRGDQNAFEPSERFLAVCVEMDEGRRIEFRCTQNPEQTVRFMEGLRQLCASRLVMHQLLNDFSLTADGFERARSLNESDFQEWLEMGTESL